MKKPVEFISIILLLFFAIVGVVASIFTLREFYLESKYSELYINNCQKVKVGMTLTKAMVIMGGENYNMNHKTFTYHTSLEKGKPRSFTIDYPTSSSSYNSVIHYDPVSGLVTEVECLGY